MKDSIIHLNNLFLEQKKIATRLHHSLGAATTDLLVKLSDLNNLVLESITSDKLDRFIKLGIKDANGSKYLTGLIWGEDDDRNDRAQPNGIIQLLRHQNELIAALRQPVDNQPVDKTGESITKKLLIFLEQDLHLFDRFKADFQARYQEGLSLQVIGFGEISTVLQFAGGRTFYNPQLERENWVYKKMPIFPDVTEVEKFVTIFEEYRRLFTEEIGIDIPEQRIQIHPVAEDKIRLYVLQRKCNMQAVGNQLIQRLDEDESATLLTMILHELTKVWAYNRSHQNISVAIDGQISNWVLDNFDPEKDQLRGSQKLVYIDTSSPLYQIDGQEQLNPELFLKSTPFFLRPIIRAFFLQEVLDRYYDFHLVVVDLIANFFKEGRAEYIPRMIETANHFFATEIPEFNVEPITEKEVTKYYKSDAFIWRFYLAARKTDRFITEKILGKKYEFRLPEKVKR